MQSLVAQESNKGPAAIEDIVQDLVMKEINEKWAWDKQSPVPSKGRAGSRSVDEYRALGYTAAMLDPLLLAFIKEYANVEDKHPGCVAECVEICQLNALKSLDDLRKLARR